MDLGNFPALTFAEAKHPRDNASLTQSLRAAISRELNGIVISGERIALTDFQKRAWDSLQHSRALAISAPTSAGKSFLVIEHLCRLVEQADSFTAVYIAPTRALLSEVCSVIRRRMDGIEGVRVSTVPSIDAEHSPRQIFVLTEGAPAGPFGHLHDRLRCGGGRRGSELL